MNYIMIIFMNNKNFISNQINNNWIRYYYHIWPKKKQKKNNKYVLLLYLAPQKDICLKTANHGDLLKSSNHKKNITIRTISHISSLISPLPHIIPHLWHFVLLLHNEWFFILCFLYFLTVSTLCLSLLRKKNTDRESTWVVPKNLHVTHKGQYRHFVN